MCSSSPTDHSLMYGRAPTKVYRPMCSPRSTDSRRKECGSWAATARKAETGVSKSALTVLTTGTKVASRARRENSLNSGCSMMVVRRRRGAVWLSGECLDYMGSARLRSCAVRFFDSKLTRGSTAGRAKSAEQHGWDGSCLHTVAAVTSALPGITFGTSETIDGGLPASED